MSDTLRGKWDALRKRFPQAIPEADEQALFRAYMVGAIAMEQLLVACGDDQAKRSALREEVGQIALDLMTQIADEGRIM